MAPGLLAGLLADDLERARRAAARGRGKAAVRHAWNAGIRAHARSDQDCLAEVVALLERLAASAAAGEAGGPVAAGPDSVLAAEAEKARAYCAACLADLRAGKRPQSVLGRLLGGGGAGTGFRGPARDRRVEKTCPDCAENVLEAANVCRFCGHRFDADPNA